MTKETFDNITLYSSTDPEALLIQPVDDHDLEGLDRQIEYISGLTQKPFALAAFKVSDWNSDLSPWSAPPVFGNEPFGSGAAHTLETITNELIPDLTLRLALHKDIKKVIGGYSLAGFFALWAVFNTDLFSAAAACSPSVWFPGWPGYMEAHTCRADAVYLSLGDKEPRTKNQTMSTVGERITSTHQHLRDRHITTALQWEQGGHFKDPDLRTARGFAWCLNK